jgi:hypothetical protein
MKYSVRFQLSSRNISGLCVRIIVAALSAIEYAATIRDIFAYDPSKRGMPIGRIRALFERMPLQP